MIRLRKSTFNPLLLLFCAISFFGACSATQGQIDCHWTGGSNGLWYSAGSWTPTGIPDNVGALYYNVFIDEDPNTDVVVVVDTPPSDLLEIDSLTLDAGDTVRLEEDLTRMVIAYDPGRIDSGRLNNSGEIIIDAPAGGTTRLSLETDSIISGGGTITLTGDGNSWFTGFAIESLNVVNVDNLIQGKGLLGNGSLTLINQAAGIIDANDPTGNLIVTPRANTTFVNQGLMQASSGGELVLSATYNNLGGTIQANNNSTITLGAGFAAANISGGVLASSGNGSFEAPTGFSPQLQDLTITGPINVNDASNLRLAGAISNQSEITVENTGSTSRVQISGAVVLDGGGTITLEGSSENSQIANTGGGNLTNVDNLIQGKGTISSIQFENQSTVVANDATGTLVLRPIANDLFTNNGLMRASDSGELVLSGAFDNQNGTIEALNNSTVTLGSGLAAADITGGILATQGTGSFEVPTGFNPELQDLTITGAINVNNSSNLRLVGAITNQSEINVENSGSTSRIQISGPVVLDGGGTIKLGGTSDNSQISNLANGNLMNLDNLIRGKGTIRNIQFTNEAIINADDPTGTLSLLPIANNSFTNTGQMIASNGGNMEISRTIENENGTIESQDGATMRFSNATINDGILRSAGTGSFDCVSGTTDLNGVRIIPGNSVGTMNMLGNFRFGVDSLLEIELESAASFDTVNVGSTLNLQGNLEIHTIGFVPSSSDTFTIVTAGSLTGSFANVANGDTLETNNGNGQFTVNYGATSSFDPNEVVLSNFQPSVILGDLNGDGVVNLLDVAPFVAAVGSGDFIPEADINQDGVVNLLDVGPFIDLLGNP